MRKLCKKLIGKRFGANLASYDENALVQREMAEKLTSQLQSHAGSDFADILEIGCGTGLLTGMIRAQLVYKKLLANDLVCECAKMIEDIVNCSFLPGDIEQLTNIKGKFDLIISNATFQWFNDLPGTLKTLGSHLKPRGIMAFSTFGPQNAQEITQITQISLHYRPLSELEKLLREEFDILYRREYLREMRFDDAQAVLRHLKNTGATGISAGSWTKSRLHDFKVRYQQNNQCGNQVKLTYQPIIIIARRSASS